eukprot:jgi/Botrbrau1/21291/Bobra.0184s0004.1
MQDRVNYHGIPCYSIDVFVGLVCAEKDVGFAGIPRFEVLQQCENACSCWGTAWQTVIGTAFQAVLRNSQLQQQHTAERLVLDNQHAGAGQFLLNVSSE